MTTATLLKVRRISLPDREAASQWTLARQLARRILHPMAASYYRGKLYGSVAKRPGGPHGSNLRDG